MKTIEERAKEYAPDIVNSDSPFPTTLATLVATERRGYIVGAEEQKRFDLEKIDRVRNEIVTVSLECLLRKLGAINMKTYAQDMHEAQKTFYKEYFNGEYCHKQSFLWGFQEGCSYKESLFLKETIDDVCSEIANELVERFKKIMEK